ncbi:N6-adenine-specific DNA methylase [Candidatus Kinetoplastibacterium blastocrithidii TCC012E]|uniref:N6-adenine-specific DNA methylase n=1 Tax=Candidatus Kinetoplastidibacterium blastocrithidiae TCC012E TaxID=1208922 RepID=M1M434_9PROT|nr:class I SAM-dependent RNA methyltransferase [Candidatus Kinetoplastibacterium blastocrithidii]AFZ83746.1 N6-adenine-specific DNA methylase [Candidatus Kinetoplastibacterium blastocrithidii (ex Strigomonas culicis)]AGF49869.1 N6-adenine-specific DNA methylase [Candidatus Kinetoplastibacterium blastocrithidii TCC012E]
MKNNSKNNLINKNKVFDVFVPCPNGIELKLSEELRSLNIDVVKTNKSGCYAKTSWDDIEYINLNSRIANRVLLQVSHSSYIKNEKDILEISHNVEWEEWFRPEYSIRVDTSSINSSFISNQYCNLLVKDGVCDRFKRIFSKRPNVNTINPDIRIHLFIEKNSVTIYLDTSGESLFKRGWRLSKGETPLKENLAAGIIALSDWDPRYNLLDPFCGSGTILIEAASKLTNTPPGILRSFGFEKINLHDKSKWNNLKKESIASIKKNMETEIIGFDIDREAIDASVNNLKISGLHTNNLRFIQKDSNNIGKLNIPSGYIITNPPYGERIKNDNDIKLWQNFSKNLKQYFFDWKVNILSSDLDLPRKLRLKPKRKIPLFNGKLDCRLFQFDIVEKSYRNN